MTKERGLGPASGRNAISLADARKKARDLWDIHKSGRDPFADLDAGRAAVAQAEAVKGRTFEVAAAEYIDAFHGEWHNPVHARQWETTLRTYVFPFMGKMIVSAIKTSDIERVLKPIWSTKTTTAVRVRGRIERILNREKAKGNRTGENPATWVGNLDDLLADPAKMQKIEKHHPAMPAAEVKDFFIKLRKDTSPVALVLEFCILTCARTAEVLGAKWNEIDLDKKLWIIPAERMGKSNKPHRVCLSTRAVAILNAMDRSGDYIFPGQINSRHYSPSVLRVKMHELGCNKYTPHGFRSTFIDWVNEETTFDAAAAELALAHIISDKTEAAYRRGDMIRKRFELAEAWAEFCTTPPIRTDNDRKNVLPMRKKARA